MSLVESHFGASRTQPPSGLLTRARIGEIEISAVTESRSRRPGADVGNTESAVVLLMEAPSRGESITLQDGREARLRAGDFTLCDTTRPYEVLSDGPYRMLVVGIPRRLLLRYVPCLEELTAVAMSARDGMNGLVSDYLRNLWARFPQGPHFPDAWQVCYATMNLIGGAYERLPHARPVRRSAASTHRSRVRSYVEKYLTDPDLTPSTIAQGCQINVRYLHRLYAFEKETLAKYILRRRLDECARALTSSHVGRSITEIAFAYGFKSATHFGRAFRERYRVTPGKYRRQLRS
jgi:AraC-like DNA-binding protein